MENPSPETVGWSDAASLKARLRAMPPWHHNVELLPGVWTNPAMGGHPWDRWRLLEPHIPSDLRGSTVLDLGASSGFFGGQMAKRGAHVVAVECLPGAVEEIRMLQAAWGAPFQIVQEDCYAFLRHCHDRFDFVFYLGLWYHLRSPLMVLDYIADMHPRAAFMQTWTRDEPRALRALRLLAFAAYRAGLELRSRRPVASVRRFVTDLTRPLQIPDDLALADSPLFDHPDWPRGYFIERSANADSTNWWVLTTPAFEACLRSAGFRRVTPLGSSTYACE